MNPSLDQDRPLPLGADLAVHKMPAHWLMARLGKRVLRPGGLETTRWLIEHADIQPSDDVVELAPGLGVTAKALLARTPHSYSGIERDPSALQIAERTLRDAGYLEAKVLRGDAGEIPLPDGAASLVFGEAMLSMQPAAKKTTILSEVRRLLRPGGRYAIHELALVPEGIDPKLQEEIQQDLSRSIHVGVRIGSVAQWRQWLNDAGFGIQAITTAPMRLLEWDRLLEDEGAWGTARFTLNTLRTPGAFSRLWEVRQTFRRHQEHLCAVAVVARRQ